MKERGEPKLMLRFLTGTPELMTVLFIRETRRGLVRKRVSSILSMLH